MRKPQVLVIFNTPVLPADHPDAAAEHDVLEATALVVKPLSEAGFPLRQLGFARDPQPLLEELRDHPPDVVFNMFEGLATNTETEASVPSLLEWLDVPFTGCPSFAIAIGRDKIRTKQLLRGAGVPTAEFQIVEQFPVSPWPYAWPAIVKPACQDCSIGIEQASVVTTQRGLDERAACMLERYGPPVLIEEFISGREFHANLIEEPQEGGGAPRLLPVPLAEIRFNRSQSSGFWPIYSYDAKWNTQTEEFRVTPLQSVVELPAPMQQAVDRVAVDAYRVLGLRDCGRVDIRLSEDGRPYVLEVNPNPYLHSDAIIDGLKVSGRSHAKFIEGLVWNAYARRTAK
jgi:D-alanine-D-alanine ligase